MKNIVEIIQEKAIAKGWKFVLFNPTSYNYEIQQLDLTDGSIVLSMTVKPPKPNIEANGFYQNEASFQIQLNVERKFELTTHSSVSETFAQKYTNRLRQMEIDLYMLIVSLNCLEDLKTVSVSQPEYTINNGSASMDGIQYNLEMTFDNVFYE